MMWSFFFEVVALLLAVQKANARVPVPIPIEAQNHNYLEPLANQQSSNGLLRLFERQANCYSPNRYCPLYNKCCSSTAGGCCPSGCTAEYPNQCCNNGGYCQIGKECCNTGCMPTGAQCCASGGYCPLPFICVLYDGSPACCTDLTCRVYLSSGITKTVATQTTAGGITAGATSFTTQSITRFYTTYTTIYYWYYWYYFYTVYYSPSTYTTRTTTTVTRTTTVYCSATDTSAAALIFLSVSSNLPTPADAQITIPATPTDGAIVIGACNTTSTLTFTGSNGSTSKSTTSLCQTLTATRNADVASAASSAASSAVASLSNIVASSVTSAGATPTRSSGAGSKVVTSNLPVGTISWAFFVLVPILIAGTMIAL